MLDAVRGRAMPGELEGPLRRSRGPEAEGGSDRGAAVVDLKRGRRAWIREGPVAGAHAGGQNRTRGAGSSGALAADAEGPVMRQSVEVLHVGNARRRDAHGGHAAILERLDRRPQGVQCSDPAASADGSTGLLRSEKVLEHVGSSFLQGKASLGFRQKRPSGSGDCSVVRSRGTRSKSRLDRSSRDSRDSRGECDVCERRYWTDALEHSSSPKPAEG